MFWRVGIRISFSASTRGQWMCVNASRLFRKLETDIRAGTDAHQAEQRRAEFRHRQTVVDRRQENNTEHNRPGENLKAMEAVLFGCPLAQPIRKQPLPFLGARS